ncbi:MAG: DUF177 domain-containing protein [Acidobacteriota bacterium]|nr:DUF177 domain-containing protein [Acidobacteriota bacterium]
MIIDLITSGSSPFNFTALFAPEEIDLEGENAELKSPVNVEGKLTKRIAQADLEGEISTDIIIECSRCLQPIEKSLTFPFDVSYVAPEHYSQAKEVEIREDDLEVALFDGQNIDIKELVREQILLNLPTQEFCSEDCKGLCPKCGANRNLIDCNCEEKEVDPRWSALRNLK